MFAHGVHAPEFFAFLVAMDAHIAHCDLLAKIRDKAGDVDEILGVWDEERVRGGHVREVSLERGGDGRAEEAVVLGETRARSGDFLVDALDELVVI